MTNTPTYLPRHRAPNGTGEVGRINLPLLPEERAELEVMAAADGRTLSAMARVLTLRGMAELRRKEGATT